MSKKKSAVAIPAVAVPSVRIAPEDLLTLDEVAARLKQTPKSIYSLTRSRSVRRIPHMKCGKRLLFSWVEVSNWLAASQTVKP